MDKVETVNVRGTPIRLWRGNGRLGVWMDRFEETEPELLDWIDRMPVGAVYYDLGASIGHFALYAAIARQAEVVAFEPEAQNYATLERHHHLNRAALTRPFVSLPVAAGAAPGLDWLHCRHWGAGEHVKIVGAAVTRDGAESFAAEHRQAILIDGLDRIRERGALPCPTHLKIDVDGAEIPALEGARTTLQDPDLQSVFIELDGGAPPDAPEARILREHGFVESSRHPVVRLRGGHYPGLFNVVFDRTGPGTSADQARRSAAGPGGG